MPVPEDGLLNLRLLAVNESKQKLIGLYQVKTQESVRYSKVPFDKCIDKEASITFSLRVNDRA